MMRKIMWVIVLLFFWIRGYSTSYYFSNSGLTTNTGLSPASPWPFSKLNFAFLPDDQILFNKGETFVGTITVSRNGTSGHPIIYSSYGSGAQPIITGFQTVSSWSNLGANIWESTTPISTLPQLNMVLMGGVNTAMGRFPQTGYMTIGAMPAPSTTTLSSSSLNASVTNWTGAEVVIRKVAWITDRNLITSASGQTINFAASADGYPAQAGGWGCFIEDDARTLTYQNAWYYNPTTKKIQIYSTSTPTNVQVATVDTLVTIQNRHDVTIDGITFTGANHFGFAISSSNVTIQNCVIDYSGTYAVWGGQNNATSTGFIFQNNTINHSNNNGILLRSNFTAAIVQNNLVKNTGLLEGMMDRISTSNQYGLGVQLRADNIMCQFNEVDSSGYIGIGFFGNNITVQYNFVNGALLTLSDGGLIYTFIGFAADHITPLPPTTGCKVLHNICLNAIGVNAGTPNTGLPQAQGIYMDDCTGNVEVGYNTVAASGNSGIFLHNTVNMNVHDNTLYNCGNGIVFDCTANLRRIRNTTLKNNILVGRTATPLPAQNAANPRTSFDQTDLRLFGSASSIDSNAYAVPIDDNLTFLIKQGAPVPASFTDQSLAQWQVYSLFDAHSTKSPFAITNVNQLFFAYNHTNHDSTVVLPAGTWIDMHNVTYNTGSVVLAAYTSIVLVNTGTNVAPTANAGTNKNISLPTSSVTQVGSGTDSDGTIAGYLWTQFSGPATVGFGSSASATTTVTGMTVAGTYVVQLRVTDNFGLIGIDTASIVVNASPPVNIPPTSDAGTNKNITLPTSSVTQVGSGTDPDGSIVAYLWTQVAGPITANIVSPTSSTTVINGMTVAGSYGFQLRVTDNLGATGSATATIIVNTAAPIPPTANAGSDQAIAWPLNSVSLSGSGIDPDGTIQGYNWSKISGGAATITSANSQNTTVTGLAVGVYQFQLTVTDNSGATGTDNIQVTVNKGNASLSYIILSNVFNNTPQAVGILTNPAGLATSTLYNGVGATPINRGAYAVNSNITDPNWNSTAISGTYTITPKPGSITVSNLSFVYDGTGKSVSVSTSDPFVTVTTYNGSATLPINANNSIQVITKTNDPNYQVTPDTSIMVINQATPTLTSWTPTSPITYPVAIGGSQLNAVWSVAGASTYNPVSGTVPNAGTLTITLDFVPSSSNYKSVLGTTRTITVNQGSTSIAVLNTTQFFDGLPKPITASSGQPGTLTITYDGSTTTPPSSLGDHPFTVTYSSANYTATPVSGTLHIISNAATIFITNFSNIVYTGLPINVTVTSPYTYSLVYNPSGHTTVGSYQVIATINDGVHSGADTVTMTVIKANPDKSWATPASIPYGTLLSSTQLNAFSSIPGAWSYSTPIGTKLPVGVNPVTATFTPTDLVDYNIVTITVNITVTQATATMSFINTTFTYDGTAKSPQVVTSPVNLTGVAITGAPQTNAGSYPISAILTNSNYQATPISGTLTINKATNYTLAWSAPTPIQQGSIITASILSATSTIAGSFSYNYPVGTIMGVPGTYLLIATFTPSDQNFGVQTISVALSVYGNPFYPTFFIMDNPVYLNLPNQ